MGSRKKKASSVSRSMTVAMVLLVVAVLILVALITHRGIDDARITGEVDAQLNPFDIKYHNQGGMLGAYLSYVLFSLIGWLAFSVPLLVVWLSLRLVAGELSAKLRSTGVILLVGSTLCTVMYNIHILLDPVLRTGSHLMGGILVRQVTILSVRIVGEVGSYVLMTGAILVLLIALTPIASLLSIRFPALPRPSLRWFPDSLGKVWRGIRQVFTIDWIRADVSDEYEDELDEEDEPVPASPKRSKPTHAGPDQSPEEQIVSAEKKPARRKTTLVRTSEQLQMKSIEYEYPKIDLLEDNPAFGEVVTSEELRTSAGMLKETLETFGVRIDGDISSFPGPVITRYEFKPAAGIKVNQIINLSDDLALAMKAKRIRIIAPIPGKAAVGVEIPNRNPQTVYLKDILQDQAFQSNDYILPLALGKTTAGRPFVVDLAKMPHLLVAGATGSGKSVCINVLITSLLYRLHPYQVRFVFIDPKMLELSVYTGIPHMGRPVVTKPKRAEKVLADAVVEMESRYRKLANASVRSIQDFNKKQAEPEDRLPYILIFVDELADLMMSSTSSKTELLITRLAQMSRAVGIHLVLATQRPSVDVITGLIKANFPARIAFQVSSKVDSRTIIDANGAEKLLGNGDMLYLASGQPEPVRIHGAFVQSEETDRIVQVIKDQGLEARPLENISQATGEITQSEVDFGDPLFKEACDVVVRHKQGSVSLLQRRLGIGYQRAARLIDKLEQAGIVSKFDGSKARDVLVDKPYIDTLFARGAVAGSPKEPTSN